MREAGLPAALLCSTGDGSILLAHRQKGRGRRGSWWADARIFSDAARELADGRVLEGVRCGLCGLERAPGVDMHDWAAGHLLAPPGCLRALV